MTIRRGWGCDTILLELKHTHLPFWKPHTDPPGRSSHRGTDPAQIYSPRHWTETKFELISKNTIIETIGCNLDIVQISSFGIYLSCPFRFNIARLSVDYRKYKFRLECYIFKMIIRYIVLLINFQTNPPDNQCCLLNSKQRNGELDDIQKLPKTIIFKQNY